MIKKLGSLIVKHRARLATTVICLILCAANLFLTVSGTNTIRIFLNGEEHEISTYRTNAEDVLAQSGIEYDKDTSYVDSSLFDDYGIISIDALTTVTVIDEGKETTISGHGTVSDILAENNIKLNEFDKIEGADRDDYIADNSTITIKRAHSVMISADGDVTTVYLAEGTISDALDLAVITADDDDIVSVPLNTPVTSNTSVRITRIEIKERKETQTVKHTTKKVETSTLNEGQSKVKQQGVDGERVLTYQDKYVDGKLEESNLLKTETTKEMVEEILLVGPARSVAASAMQSGGQGVKLASGVRTISLMTPPSSLELTANNTPAVYKQILHGTATAYHCGTHTSTGQRVSPGMVAVNPKQIPYHTKMWIVSDDGKYVYGYCAAEDTGGFIYLTGSRATICDLYMPSESECYEFGRRAVTIYIL